MSRAAGQERRGDALVRFGARIHLLRAPAAMVPSAATVPVGLSVSLLRDVSFSEGDGHASRAPHVLPCIAPAQPAHEPVGDTPRAADTCDGLCPAHRNTAGRADHARTDSCFTNL